MLEQDKHPVQQRLPLFFRYEQGCSDYKYEKLGK